GPANVLVERDDRRMALWAANGERLKHEGGNIEIADRAPIGDLVHLHDAVACRAPCLVGLGLLLKLAVEVGLARRILPAKRDRCEDQCKQGDWGSHAPRSYTGGGSEARACARVSHWQSSCAASAGVRP